MGTGALSESASEASALSESASEASALSESASEASALSEWSSPRPLAVCVYCASTDGIAARHLELARSVGTGIAARGWTLVSGGGRRSMMGAVARAARAGGARTIGVIPQAMVEREWADHDSDEMLVTDTMRERKARMDASADAFITLAGGLGTCEELLETWSAAALGLHAKPVVLLDPHGHYAGLLDWLGGLVTAGFARPEAVERLAVCTEVDAALDRCLPRSWPG